MRSSIQTENKVQENSYPKKRDLSYVAARSLNYKTHDKNKTSAPVSATGADGYLLVEATGLAQQRAEMLAFCSDACSVTAGHSHASHGDGDMPSSSSLSADIA